MKNDLRLRAATLAPDTYDAESNTIEVVLSTGADVQRSGFVERLPINAADLRGVAGKPVLDAHNQGSTRAVLGVIEKAWKVGGEIRALLKLSSRDDVAGLVRDIADGILRNLSIGYRVTRWADSTDSKGNRIRTAVAWSIHEASFVPIGADAGAVTRSHPMKKKQAGADPAPEDDNEGTTEATVSETRAEIRDIIKRAGGTSEQADELIDGDSTVEQARAAAYEIMTARTQQTPRVRIVASNDDPATIVKRRSDALYARVTGTKPEDAARAYVNDRVVDHARGLLAVRGVSTTGLSDHDILTRAHSVSDFPLLLEGTGNRILLEQFEAAQTPLLKLGRTATAPDFRPLNRLRISEMGALQPLTENGEIKRVSRSEIADSYGIESAGAIFSLSFKAQTNDDLSAFADFNRAAAVQAAQYQKAVIVDLIQGNGNMEDGQPLFSVAHGNISDNPSRIFGIGEDPLQPLSDARYALRTQKGLDGVTPLNLRPAYLVVSAELETEGERALAEINAQVARDVNPFSGAMELLVESAFTNPDWYVFASPNSCPVFEHAWLQGFTGPQLASRENFDTLARDFRVVIHWGAGLLPGGWRGAYVNYGSEDSNS